MNFHRSISLGSYSRLKSEVVEDFPPKYAFLEKRRLMESFSKTCSERIHRDTDPRLVCKFHEVWSTGKSVKLCVIYLTKKTKYRLALASARIAPKIRQDQWQTTCSECPEFHPNRFTSGEVTAEHETIVKTHHKVFSNTRLVKIPVHSVGLFHELT